MKTYFTFLLFSIFSLTIFSQNTNEPIISFNTIERNKKNVTFFKMISGSNSSFLITANNGYNKDYSKCKWESFFSNKLMASFINELYIINKEELNKISSNNFIFKNKKDKTRIELVNSRCSQQHKSHYFQESCNRKLSFVLTDLQKEELITKMEMLLIGKSHVMR